MNLLSIKANTPYTSSQNVKSEQKGEMVYTTYENNKNVPYDCVISASGGLDSGVLLALLKESKKNPLCVNFYYGSKHGRREQYSFYELMCHYQCDSLEVNVSSLFQIASTSSLMRFSVSEVNEVPEGHYEEETMRATVVPGRNTFFASYLAMVAEVVKANKVYLGVHAGDHFIYPDCRPVWFSAIQNTIHASTDGKVLVEAPFLYEKKAGIVKHGIDLKVPFDRTWTCYSGQIIACGKCGSCQERLEAFKLNGIEDPLNYTTREILPKKGP